MIDKVAKDANDERAAYLSGVGKNGDNLISILSIAGMFADKEVKAIFCLSGGFNSNTIFEYLDYDVIKNNPKPICGFSDSTSITNVIFEKTGVRSST